MCIETNQKDFIMFIKLVKENDTPVLLASIFHSLEAGIADTISASSDEKYFLFFNLQYLIIGLNEHLTFFKFSDISIDQKHA